jgi:hypothetical protein
MKQKKPDFFIDTELVCVASADLTPELQCSGILSFEAEKKKLREILDACEQYSNR